MKTNPHVEDFKPSDIWHLAANLRKCDCEEVMASDGVGPLTALYQSTKSSTICWTFWDGDLPVAIFGVGSYDVNAAYGSPWLLATDGLEAVQLYFLKHSAEYVRLMLDRHSYLENWVDTRNVTSINWLKWCGFKFDEPKPHGVKGLPFQRFEMRR